MTGQARLNQFAVRNSCRFALPSNGVPIVELELPAEMSQRHAGIPTFYNVALIAPNNL